MPDAKPLTEKQLGILERYGYDVNVVDDAEGKEILDAIAANGWKPLADGPLQDVPKKPFDTPLDPNGPATKKQKEILAKFDYDPNVTFAQASSVIDELKANGWKRPAAMEV